jgi:integrase
MRATKKRRQRDFYLYKRPTSDPRQHVYYVQFVKDGKRLTAKSTGQTTRNDAEGWARDHMVQGIPDQPTLEEYAKDFFDESKCTWVKTQRAKGRPFSKAVAAQRRSHVVNYLIPQFGKLQLTEITKRNVEAWLADLPLANSSRNQLLFSLRIILRDAVDAEILYANPLERCEMFGKDTIERDPFTLAEMHALFPDSFDKLVKVWGDAEHATAFTLLATTGVRCGEVRALRWLHLLEGGRALLIDSAFKHDGTLGTTKSGDARAVLVPAQAQRVLSWWRRKTTWKDPDDLLFRDAAGNPRNHNWLRRAFRPALDAAKIKPGDRNIVVHSFRHTYNSMMRTVLPDAILRAMTGHRSESMTRVYDHPDAEALVRRLDSVKGLIDAPWEKKDNIRKLTPGGGP